eukprot:364979-Chlamydomonas_euryale.AAC.3
MSSSLLSFLFPLPCCPLPERSGHRDTNVLFLNGRYRSPPPPRLRVTAALTESISRSAPMHLGTLTGALGPPLAGRHAPPRMYRQVTEEPQRLRRARRGIKSQSVTDTGNANVRCQSQTTNAATVT